MSCNRSHVASLLTVACKKGETRGLRRPVGGADRTVRPDGRARTRAFSADRAQNDL